MNKIVGFQLILIGLVLDCFVAYSQNETKDFNGVIKYELKYEGDVDQNVLEQQPKELELKFNGNKIRTDIDEGGTSIAIIKNSENKTIITLMDISLLNKKVMTKTTREEINNKISLAPSSNIKLIDSTKVIAGYKCKKGELITKDNDGKMSVDEFYYTDELGSNDYNFDGPYRDIKGILMQFATNEDNIKIIATATSINKKSISDKDFMVPPGYEEITMEQLTKLIDN